MQTFVPYTCHKKTAACLDRARLGKQRVEGLQILNALTGVSSGWVNHPATKMWAGHEAGLCAYIIFVCQEWMDRGYVDNVCDKVVDIVYPDPDDLPFWWGDPRVHESHKANLVRKLPGYYRSFWPTVDETIPYFWPV